MQILISRSGLVLNPGQMADLVLAWRQVAGLIAAIPTGRPLVDDLAYSFRLPAPGGAAVSAPSVAKAPAGKSPAGKPVAKAKAKAAAKAKPQPRKQAAAKKAQAKSKSRAKPARKAPARGRATRRR